MDEAARYNQARWRALAQANALFTRPKTDMDIETARRITGTPEGDLKGQHVLCLAGGGGQQSVAYGLLGADVTVVDLSPEQIERDEQMAVHYSLDFTLHVADMRDLSMLESDSFDIVDQPYALNFVPDAETVFAAVGRVIKSGGVYTFMCANPFSVGVRHYDWDGEGYSVKQPYVQGQRIEYPDEDWVYDRESGVEVAPPVEYRHTLNTLVDGLVKNGFVIQQMQEAGSYDPDSGAAPGTWEHFSAVLPPWLVFQSKRT